MKKIILFHTKDTNLYTFSQVKDHDLTLLAFFLTDDFLLDENFFITWLNKNDNDVTGGNIVILKKENDYIYLIDEIFTNHIIKFTRKLFLEIVKEWKEIYKQQPQEVLLERRDGKYIFTIVKL